jgi:hypothetical protein
MSGQLRRGSWPSSYSTVNKQASLFQKGIALEDRLWNFLMSLHLRTAAPLQLSANGGIPPPQWSTQRDRACFSVPRQERYEIRHGFEQLVFIDLYRAAALP